MLRDVDRVLISRDRIAHRVKEVAHAITRDLCGGDDPETLDRNEITLVPILTGSVIFLADLIRHLPLRMRVKLISVSSYPGASTATRGVTIESALNTIPERLDGQKVLLIDDILDSGLTLDAVGKLIAARNPAVLKTCVLLRKLRDQPPKRDADYACFDIPDEFVVGYGLDFDGYYRNLPEIVTLKPEVIQARQAMSAGAADKSAAKSAQPTP